MQQFDPAQWEVYIKSLNVTFGHPKLVGPRDPILRKELPPFSFSNPPVDPSKFSMWMAQAMLDLKGLGLAANQLGFEHRCCCIQGADQFIVMFNPVIVNTSDDYIPLEEACLSFPDIILKVKRPKSIRIRFTLPNGETLTERYTGITARIMQHEVSHLNGEIFAANVTKLEKMLAIKKANKQGNHYVIADLM
jgi:peptide deformylase